MRVTIEINSYSELEMLSNLFKEFKIETVNVMTTDDAQNAINKGDKTIDPQSLFGIWAKQPRDLVSLYINLLE